MYANPFGAPDPEFNRFYFNDNPTAAWWDYIMRFNLGGTNNPSRYAQSQQNRYYNMFQAEAPNNPSEGFYDWLNRKSPGLQGEYFTQSPNQRGDFTLGNYQPRARWVMG